MLRSIRDFVHFIQNKRNEKFFLDKVKNKKRIIFCDIDDTIAVLTNNNRVNDLPDFASAVPIKENIEKINKLYDEGAIIVYFTARESLQSKHSFYKLTKKQLDSWGAKYNFLRTDKPYFDILIDDRTKRIEEI